jgi:hypothetical protein
MRSSGATFLFKKYDQATLDIQSIVQLGVEEVEAIFAKSYENISLHWLEFI